MYADHHTQAIKNTVSITQKRRACQMAYNQERGITPKTIIRKLGAEMGVSEEILDKDQEHHPLTLEEIEKQIEENTKRMQLAAKEFRFEDAAKYRDLVKKYQEIEIKMS